MRKTLKEERSLMKECKRKVEPGPPNRTRFRKSWGQFMIRRHTPESGFITCLFFSTRSQVVCIPPIDLKRRLKVSLFIHTNPLRDFFPYASSGSCAKILKREDRLGMDLKTELRGIVLSINYDFG